MAKLFFVMSQILFELHIFILRREYILIWSCPILIGEKYEGAKDAQVWALEQVKQNVCLRISMKCS